MIRTEAASLLYTDHGREVYACQDVTVQLKEDEFVGILGPSGSGKSSLLYLLSGLKVPTQGEIFLDDTNLNRLSDYDRSQLRLREFGFIFQLPYLLGYLTALENVLVSSYDPNQREHAEELLDQLGIGHKAGWLPHELSGGERQRVCVARALIGNPRVIFADEPTASLDHQNGVQVVELLNRHRGKGTLVMVTHDPSMLVNADRILTIAEGRVLVQENGKIS